MLTRERRAGGLALIFSWQLELERIRRRHMKHIRMVSRGRVVKAKYESILELVGLLNAIMT